MENLIIEKTNYTPQIDFNAQIGVLQIDGKSYPENTFEFYKQVKEWLKEYISSFEIEKITVNIELTYLNSSSLKAYFDIFDIFEEAQEGGKNIIINWIYYFDDDILKETGEDFKEDFDNLTINLIEKD